MERTEFDNADEAAFSLHKALTNKSPAHAKSYERLHKDRRAAGTKAPEAFDAGEANEEHSLADLICTRGR